jgi:hypothetical protein
MEISPANIAQVELGRDGRMITIDDDVLNIAKDLKEIDENLRLRWVEKAEYFCVYEIEEDGSEALVLTSQELNPQIVERVRQIAHPSYKYAEELDKLDAQVDRDFDHAQRERLGEAAELLSFAVRKDLGLTNRAFIKDTKVDGS